MPTQSPNWLHRCTGCRFLEMRVVEGRPMDFYVHQREHSAQAPDDSNTLLIRFGNYPGEFYHSTIAEYLAEQADDAVSVAAQQVIREHTLA